MKSGEKMVLRVVLIAFIGVIGFTVYLEMQHQDSYSFKNPASNKESSQELMAQMQGVAISNVVIPKGMSPDGLPDADSRGATLLTLYCTQCHDLPIPAMHNASEWPMILARMQAHLQGAKNGALTHVIQPPKKDWAILGNYLSEYAQIALNPLKYADIDSAQGQAFISVCSQCHEAPSPESHTTNEWPRVVLRMKSNMLVSHKPVPSQEKLMDIIGFLQSHSKDHS